MYLYLSEVEVVLSYFESYFEGEEAYVFLLVEFVPCISSTILVEASSGAELRRFKVTLMCPLGILVEP